MSLELDQSFQISTFSPFQARELDDAFIQIPEGQLPGILERANMDYQTLNRQGFLHFKTYESDIRQPSEKQLLDLLDPLRNKSNEHNSMMDINIYNITAHQQYIYCVDKMAYFHTKSFKEIREKHSQYMKLKNIPMHVTTESYLDFLRRLVYATGTSLMTFHAVLLGKLPLFPFTTNNFNIESLKNPLQMMPDNVPGSVNCNTNIGSPLSMFTAHEENFSANRICVNYGPGTKVWFILNYDNSRNYTNHMTRVGKNILETKSGLNNQCPKWLQHDKVFTDPQLLRDAGIRFTVVTQAAGDIIITGAGCIRFGFNLSFNVATASNIILYDFVLFIPATVEQCRCDPGVYMDPDILAKFIRIGRQEFRMKFPELILEPSEDDGDECDSAPSSNVTNTH